MDMRINFYNCDPLPTEQGASGVFHLFRAYLKFRLPGRGQRNSAIGLNDEQRSTAAEGT